LRIRCFSTGAVRTKRRERGVRRYFPGGWGGKALPVNVFLIEHPEGLCLFDAGQTARASGRGYFPAWHPYFKLARFELGRHEEAVAQIGEAGYSVDEIRWIVLSHMHTDHVGGLGELTRGEVLVSRDEWSRATGLRGRIRGYLPQHWPSARVPRLVDFTGPSLGPFPSSLSLLGDASLVLVPIPGHTPGHMGLLVQDDDHRFLLCGDMVHSGSEVEDASQPLAEFCRRERLTVLAAHDPGAALLAALSTR
jgi:N-acyl homoserine lactone hydrolase